MSFTIGIHFKNGEKNYSKKGEKWTVAKRFAMMASRETDVAQVMLNCEGITQQIYVNGKGQWTSGREGHPEHTAKCPHGNHHQD